MKLAWVDIRPWDKPIAIAALETGADAVVLEAGDAPKMRELGVMRVVAPDGDLKPEADVVRIAVESKADEERAAAVSPEKTLVLALRDWKIIPLENLIARRDRLMVEVADEEDALMAMQTLEKGADGVVVVSRDPAQVRKIVAAVHEVVEPVALEVATVTEVRKLGMGDRVCVDTTTQMRPGEGMLVGNASSGFLLVHAETLENPYVAARPFRVNAGAVHAYVLGPGGDTRYLSELKAGDQVLLVGHDGTTQVGFVGRCKVERRPLLLVRAEVEGNEIGLVLQNAETIRLTAPEGGSVSVAVLKPGDQVLAHRTRGGRHFGMKIEETIREV